jgi:hypothetical protein
MLTDGLVKIGRHGRRFATNNRNPFGIGSAHYLTH